MKLRYKTAKCVHHPSRDPPDTTDRYCLRSHTRPSRRAVIAEALLAEQLVPAGSSSTRLPRSIVVLVRALLPGPALHTHLHGATELPSVGRQLCEGGMSSSSAGRALPRAWGREQAKMQGAMCSVDNPSRPLRFAFVASSCWSVLPFSELAQFL